MAQGCAGGGKRSKANSEPLTPMEEADLPSPTAETRDKFPLDRRIREKGWRIESRPGSGQPTWRKNGVVRLQSEVVLVEGL